MLKRALCGALVVLCISYIWQGAGAPLWQGLAMLGIVGAIVLVE